MTLVAAMLAGVGALVSLATSAPAYAAGTTFYTAPSPSGSGNACSSSEPCSLTTALMDADSATVPVIVVLASGTSTSSPDTYSGHFTIDSTSVSSITLEPSTPASAPGETVLSGAGSITLGIASGNGAAVTLDDIEITGGSHPGGNGSGVVNDGTGSLTVTDSLITDNTTTGRAGYATFGGSGGEGYDSDSGSGGTGGNGAGVDGTGPVALAGSVLAENSPDDCDTATSSSIADLGSNIADDDSCRFTKSSSVSDSTSLDGSLGALADNGGPTDTVAPTRTVLRRRQQT